MEKYTILEKKLKLAMNKQTKNLRSTFKISIKKQKLLTKKTNIERVT